MDVVLAKPRQKRRHALVLVAGVELVDEAIALGLDRQAVAGKAIGEFLKRVVEFEDQLLAAKLGISACLSSTSSNSPPLMTPTRSAISSASSI